MTTKAELIAKIIEKDRFIAALQNRIDSLNMVSKFNKYVRILDKNTGETLVDKPVERVTIIFYGD